MEENIKILEEYLNKNDRQFMSEKRYKFLNALENLIEAYKKLEGKWDKDTHKLQNALDMVNADKINNYIPVSLVEEKIEELSEDLETMKVDAMYGRYKEYGSKLSFEKQFSYKYGMHDILQELLEKRK